MNKVEKMYGLWFVLLLSCRSDYDEELKNAKQMKTFVQRGKICVDI
jgi:hypothetical protein